MDMKIKERWLKHTEIKYIEQINLKGVIIKQKRQENVKILIKTCTKSLRKEGLDTCKIWTIPHIYLQLVDC